MTSPCILSFAASTRVGSFNKCLADHVSAKLGEAGAQVTRLDLTEFSLPIYNEDLESRHGLPQAARDLHALFRGHHGVFIASPEYNANATPLLVNLLAWVSRVREHGGMGAGFGRAVFALGSASPGGFGGYRGLMALRQSLELQLGARVLPDMVAVSRAQAAFDSGGALTSPPALQMSERLVRRLLAAVTQTV